MADSNANGINGVITFKQEDKNSPLRISGTVNNLPVGPHGFHIHERKQTGNDCGSAGGHWNPENVRTFFTLNRLVCGPWIQRSSNGIFNCSGI